MLLHLSDWDDYPDAIPDWNTTNDSFLKLAAKYKSMGVANFYFHLALMQPHLQGVDPHDPDLSDEIKIDIWKECVANPWYFIREVIRIKAGDYIPYIANRGNIALMWLFLNHIDLFLIQPRQTGKSVGADCLMTWLIHFGCYNIDITLITKDHKLRTDNILRLKAIRDAIPAYLIAKDKKDVDNTEEISYLARKIRYKALIPRNGESDAEKVGRGATSPILQFDEAPFINWIGITLPSAMGSSVAAVNNAKRLGAPHGTLYTTTAGKIDSRDGKFIYDMVSTAAPWTELFYDAGNQARLVEMVAANSTDPKGAIRVNCTFSHRQLGYSDQWLWETMARLNVSGEIADRDFFNRWTNGTGTNPIDADVLERIASSEREPDHIQIHPDGYIVRWYVPKDKIDLRMATGQYIMGLDTSDAVGRDGISMVLLDVRDLSVVAAGSYNRTSIYRWISFMGQFLCKYPNIVLIPEAKSSGRSIMDGLIQILDANGFDPFKRIFNTIVDRKEKYQEEYNQSGNITQRRRMYHTHKEHFGFNTTGTSRETLYVDVMETSLNDAAHCVRDKKLAGEFKGLVIRNDRIDHQTGGHDDMVIAYLLANWFLIHGRNLSHYGINTRDVRSLVVRAQTDDVSVADMLAARRNKEIRSQLDELCERLANCDLDNEALRIEHRIRFLMTQAGTDAESFDSIQQLIDNASVKRRERTRGHRAQFGIIPHQHTGPRLMAA